MDSIYLDHNSTTPIAPEVAEAMAACHRAGYMNPASQHAPGRTARRKLEEAREGIAEMLGAKTTGMDADQVIFTSGGTEANNLALFGLARGLNSEGEADREGEAPAEPPGRAFALAQQEPRTPRVIISRIEHPSIVGAADYMQQRGWKLDRLRVCGDGVVDVEHLRELLDDDPEAGAPNCVVSVMLGNNETGVLQPVREIAEVCRQNRPQVHSRSAATKDALRNPRPPGTGGLLCHTDAVQVAGKLPINFRELGVDALSISAHKLHGPRGIGALVVRHGVEVRPILYGGFQQGGQRPGTEDVALAVGMFTALELWQAEAEQRAAQMGSLRDRFEAQLLAGDATIVINGAGARRLPHTSNVSFPGLDRQVLLMALDLAGIACSTGSACASGSSEPSPVLLAMGCAEAVISGALRFSLGAATTPAEVDEAARRILCVAEDLRRQEFTAFGAAGPRY